MTTKMLAYVFTLNVHYKSGWRARQRGNPLGCRCVRHWPHVSRTHPTTAALWPAACRTLAPAHTRTQRRSPALTGFPITPVLPDPGNGIWDTDGVRGAAVYSNKRDISACAIVSRLNGEEHFFLH